jgi:hypothetical protein
MIDIVCIRFKQPLTLLFCLACFGECNTLFKDDHFLLTTNSIIFE